MNLKISVEWQPLEQISINFNQTTTIFIQENESENVICQPAAILSEPQCELLVIWGGRFKNAYELLNLRALNVTYE